MASSRLKEEEEEEKEEEKKKKKRRKIRHRRNWGTQQKKKSSLLVSLELIGGDSRTILSDSRRFSFFEWSASISRRFLGRWRRHSKAKAPRDAQRKRIVSERRKKNEEVR